MQAGLWVYAQRGSVLITVLGISIILTVAAAAYLAVGSNSGAIGEDYHRISQTLYAAESGLRMGMRWCRYYPETKFNADSTKYWADSLILTRSMDPDWSDWSNIDGIHVKVMFGHGTRGGVHELVSTATAGTGTDTIQLSVQIVGIHSSDETYAWLKKYSPGK